MDRLDIFYSVALIIGSLVVPLWGGNNLNFQYNEPNCGFKRIKLNKKYKKYFIFNKHAVMLLKPAVYMQASAYIYISLLLITAIILGCIMDISIWWRYVFGYVPIVYIILIVLWELYIGIKHNICKYLKERRTKRGKQDK